MYVVTHSLFILLKKPFNFWIVKCRVNEHKDKIRRVLRGRLPSEKDMKKEINQAFWFVIVTLVNYIQCATSLSRA
jgi:hypothetical protein